LNPQLSTASPHETLLASIRAEARQAGPRTGRPELAPRVLAALAAVPRDAFVEPEWQDMAWADTSLPIGYEQTISQPFVVALMTDLIEPGPDDTVLEVGTGSGYQAAVLAGLVRQVESVEVIEPLARTAARRLHELGCDNVAVHLADGHAGWPGGAPYDAIVVTAATPRVPPKLVEQLKPGGRLVLPLGPLDPHRGGQCLTLLRKTARGTLTRQSVLPVVFVPFTSGVKSGTPGSPPESAPR
jgi:protein-L-isoaspartate(D-aspartate) O-methyltransferase